ncbi:helix-turn-helix domain-containing protein [Desnuesiella massiliensis]|uniref:helix-turn-helix domain-containing protein n=1 Tax=Desnuesiella massiliensis TaxID=1650662 RepID=UPI0006E27C3C|nr:helix-turn-helix domain-containing protein [Desnuesiella massiliensis]
MEDKFYTIDQVAKILGMHHKTIRKFITEGKLWANKVGKQWRISGHDLSVFMEKNSVNINNKEAKEQENAEFSTKEGALNTVKQKINVSTVIDINEVDIDQYMRISNTLIAIMNCKDPNMGNSTINMKYYEQENRLRVMLWGSVKFTEEMLSTISLLTEPTNL